MLSSYAVPNQVHVVILLPKTGTLHFCIMHFAAYALRTPSNNDVHLLYEASPGCRLFADGDYRITNIGGQACANYLSGAVCTSGDTVGLASADTGTGQVWTLTYSTTAATANTYDVQCKNRNACNSFLSAPACTATGLGFAATVRLDQEMVLK